VNDRARDVVDLVLIRALMKGTGEPALVTVRQAILDIFNSRAVEAETLGRLVRPWPGRVVAYPHWRESFEAAAASAGLEMTLGEAVAVVNAWLDEIDAA